VAADFGFSMGLHGAWIGEQTFVIDDTTLANTGASRLAMRFAAGAGTLELAERTRETAVQIEGQAVERELGGVAGGSGRLHRRPDPRHDVARNRLGRSQAVRMRAR
jgi:hypothetical protein